MAAAPDQLAEAQALREAGFTLLSISKRTGISVTSLYRHFTADGVKKGATKAAVLKKAKQQLLDHVTSDDTIRELAAKFIADDIAHALHIRELLMVAAPHMRATNLDEAVKATRSLAAYSTALKNTSDMVRHGLRLDDIADTTDDMPELVIRELTQAEIEQMHRDRKSDEDEELEIDMVA